MKVNTKFNHRDRVFIPELNLNGKIIGIYIGSNLNIEYNIRYFKDGDVKTCYFYEDEIESAREKEELGFKS